MKDTSNQVPLSKRIRFGSSLPKMSVRGLIAWSRSEHGKKYSGTPFSSFPRKPKKPNA